MEQYLRLVVCPGGLADVGAQRHQFKLGQPTKRCLVRLVRFLPP
jgi:hypothetical protein